ncbi:MAG: dockerin type I repeat-containing protein, partial [bacterium]|nr:dockerin type I repeat-containing protein [bacterium]
GDGDAWDFIMQNVVHKNVTSREAVNISGNLTAKADGFLLYDNHFDNAKEISYDINFEAAVNSTGSNKLIIKMSDDGTVNLGDVTLDGIVSLKDCSAIYSALTGETDLTDRQCRNADVDADGKITSKDALLIKYYIMSDGAVSFG